MIFKALHFFYVQRIMGFEPPTKPHFDSQKSENWFVSHLKNSKFYLEFGTGGSTYLAAKLGVKFVAVDADRFFLKSVKKLIERDSLAKSNQRFIYVNIGFTGPWSIPLPPLPLWRKSAFSNYSDIGKHLASENEKPDLVLIDGRFRVACALRTIKYLSDGGSDWTIIVDDYEKRKDYRIIEKYADVEKKTGRMISLKRKKSLDVDNLENDILKYKHDYR